MLKVKFEKDHFYITADVVVFSVINKGLKILLIKRDHEPFKDKFALPGGFVELNEGIEDAAKRELFEETGVKDIFLKKLHPFGEVDRDPRGRVITVPFYSLIDAAKLNVSAGSDAYITKWQSAYDLPDLAFDHKKIIDDALFHLRFEINHTNIACYIMPEKFTLTELQNCYAAILNVDLDKRNFRKKMRELGILKDAHETKMDGAHRPAKLYSFKDKKYKMI